MKSIVSPTAVSTSSLTVRGVVTYVEMVSTDSGSYHVVMCAVGRSLCRAYMSALAVSTGDIVELTTSAFWISKRGDLCLDLRDVSMSTVARSQSNNSTKQEVIK